MRCRWSKHIMQCWRIKRSSEDVRWRSFSESKAPQKILMIRFETKTWLMENQVKLSCFSKCSSGDMTAVILTFTWSKSVQIWQKKTREAAAEAGHFYTKRAFTGYTTKLSIRVRRHGGDREWNKVFEASEMYQIWYSRLYTVKIACKQFKRSLKVKIKNMFESLVLLRTHPS